MGIWAEHFHPRVLLRWDVLGWIVGFFIAVAGIVLIFDQFLVANICFTLAAVFVFAKTVSDAASHTESMLNSILFAFIVCGLVGALLAGAVLGVNRYRDRHSKENRAAAALNRAQPPNGRASFASHSSPDTKLPPSRSAIATGKPSPIADAQPEISASFVQATSPGVVVWNHSQSIIRDPTCALQMWNLSKTPPLTLPTYDQPQPNRFIKPGAAVLLASLDNPIMKPLISDGDKVFGYVMVDCPDCKVSRFYWLYAPYNRPTEAWSSEIPSGTPMNVLSIGSLLEASSWDVDEFMTRVPHGPKIAAQDGRILGFAPN